MTEPWRDGPSGPELGWRPLPGGGYALLAAGEEVARMEGPNVIPFVFIRIPPLEVYFPPDLVGEAPVSDDRRYIEELAASMRATYTAWANEARQAYCLDEPAARVAWELMKERLFALSSAGRLSDGVARETIFKAHQDVAAAGSAPVVSAQTRWLWFAETDGRVH